jgi:hypothetical protein
MPTLKIKRVIEFILSPFSIEEVAKQIKRALRAIYERIVFLGSFSRFIE